MELDPIFKLGVEVIEFEKWCQNWNNQNSYPHMEN
jgi:hypothetical protein